MKPRRVGDVSPKKVKGEHPLQWLAERLQDDPTFELKSWFGGRTIMLDGKHQVFLTTQGEPWQGVLVCTSREHHESLRAEIPALVQHPVLGKWLYLPETSQSFERDAQQLIQLARSRDVRLGIEPSKRKKKVKRYRFGDQL